MADIIKKEIITLPQVKKLLEEVEQENMDQIQRWTLDYINKFVKTDAKNAEKMMKELIGECDLKEEEAVELVNCMPTSIEELRAFTFGWKKLILTDTLEKILKILSSNK